MRTGAAWHRSFHARVRTENGVWQAHGRRRGYPAQVRTFDTKAEVEEWAHSIESEIRRGVFVSRVEAEQTTLRAA